MNALETARRIIHPERNKENGFVGEKAKELWELIAPDRHPTLELPTAIHSFSYKSSQRYSIDEREIRGVSRDLKIFDSNLRHYWTTENDMFEAKLTIDPNYFNHGKLDKDTQSFEFCVDALSQQQPSDDKYITVFGFTEYVQSESFGPFKKHPKQQLLIYAEKGKYSGDLSVLLVERPSDLQDIRFITIKQAETSVEVIMPENVAWRNRFARNILDHFISSVRGESLEERKNKDKEWQQRSTRQTT